MMSSFVRTLQKRMMKRAGYERQTHELKMIDGIAQAVPIPRGKRPVLGPDGEPVGLHWPRSFSAPTREIKRKHRAPRGNRRGTHKRPQRMAAA